MGILDVPFNPRAYVLQGGVADIRAQSLQPLRQQPRIGVTWEEALVAFETAYYQLLGGTLVTKKAAQTGKEVSFGTGSAVAFLTIPNYASGSFSGVADDAAFIADKGHFTAVTHVYDHTADPTHTTNLYSSFSASLQRVTISVTADTSHTYRVVGTYLPYQGQFDNLSSSLSGTTSPMLFELLDWRAFLTTAGTNGATNQAYGPLVARLPLPLGRLNSEYTHQELRYGGGSTETDTSYMGLIEHVPIRGGRYDNNGTNDKPRRGLQFYMTGATPVRGATQTGPQISAILPSLATTPTHYLAGLAMLVRVADCSIDSSTFRVGRLMMAVAVRENATAFPTAGALSSASAVDVYALTGAPDYFEGMAVLP